MAASRPWATVPTEDGSAASGVLGRKAPEVRPPRWERSGAARLPVHTHVVIPDSNSTISPRNSHVKVDPP